MAGSLVSFLVEGGEEDEVLEAGDGEHEAGRDLAAELLFQYSYLPLLPGSRSRRKSAAGRGRKPDSKNKHTGIPKLSFVFIYHDELDKLDGGDVLLPPEMLLHGGAQRGQQVVQVHHRVDARVEEGAEPCLSPAHKPEQQPQYYSRTGRKDASVLCSSERYFSLFLLTLVPTMTRRAGWSGGSRGAPSPGCLSSGV